MEPGPERVAKADDPRSRGEALHGSRLGEFWKYRAKTTAWWFVLHCREIYR
jgi:hypothetical protein